MAEQPIVVDLATRDPRSRCATVGVNADERIVEMLLLQ